MHRPSAKMLSSGWDELPCFILDLPFKHPSVCYNGKFPESFAKLPTAPACCRWGSGARERSRGAFHPTRAWGFRLHQPPVTLLISFGQKLLETQPQSWDTR